MPEVFEERIAQETRLYADVFLPDGVVSPLLVVAIRKKLPESDVWLAQRASSGEPGGWRGGRPLLPLAARSRSKVLNPQRAEKRGESRDRTRQSAGAQGLDSSGPIEAAPRATKNGAVAPFSGNRDCPEAYFLAATGSALAAWTIPSFIVTPESVTSCAIMPSIGFWQSASKFMTFLVALS